MKLAIDVDGRPHRTDDGGTGASLLVVLRDRLGVTGPKNACEEGECGSCSVWLDGVLVNSCLVLAAQTDGRAVTTVHGLTPAGAHPVQQAFLDACAVQCGFCTPGMVVAATDLLRRTPRPSAEVVREEMAGNLCRCTGYHAIIGAVLLAAERMSAPRTGPP